MGTATVDCHTACNIQQNTVFPRRVLYEHSTRPIRSSLDTGIYRLLILGKRVFLHARSSKAIPTRVFAVNGCVVRNGLQTYYG